MKIRRNVQSLVQGDGRTDMVSTQRILFHFVQTAYNSVFLRQSASKLSTDGF
jgi:hypothetical protein